MTSYRILPLYLFICFIFIACSNRQSAKRKKFKKYYVEANFINDKIIDGEARFYDSAGILYNVSNYQNGKKNGVFINYYPNGNISDSVRYISDKEFGYWVHYDSMGNNEYGNYYYYGLQFGPELFFKGNKFHKFMFSDLNRRVLVEYYYDSKKGVDTNILFKMQFTLNAVVFENKQVLSLFGYLPILPHTIQKYAIGLTTKDHVVKELSPITGRNFLIDTLLPLPPAGWHYYVSCNLKANNDSLNRFYIDEYMYY